MHSDGMENNIETDVISSQMSGMMSIINRSYMQYANYAKMNGLETKVMTILFKLVGLYGRVRMG